MIVKYFEEYIKRGHVQFKMFFIIGYPWEKASDFEQFQNLMNRLFDIPLKKSITLRIKWTPFIPQPCTPLGDVEAQYDFDLIEKILVWHFQNKLPHSDPGWYIDNDGIMSYRSHYKQRKLTSGDETTLMHLPKAKALYKF